MSAPSLVGLLDILTQSVTSALEVVPKVAAIPQSLDGVSLLDVKNELLLSYLHHLVFFIIVKLRTTRQSHCNGNSNGASSLTNVDNASPDLSLSVVQRLVELRLFLEKGTRPLEEKMRYQIDMLVRAAGELDRKSGFNHGKKKATTSTESDSGSASGSDDYDDDDEEDDDDDDEEHVSRPRLSNIGIPTRSKPSSQSTRIPADDDQENDGIYRPPRRQRMLMDNDPSLRPNDSVRPERRAHKSATLDEFVAAELSATPMAEPSIGTNVVARGRRVKTTAERAVEQERRDYEESNFVRLPEPSKKDKARLGAAPSNRSRMVFGGEDFRDLGGQVERIERLTRSKDGAGGRGGVKALLAKSRKRGRDGGDGGGGGGGGPEIGESFRKKARIIEKGRGKKGKR